MTKNQVEIDILSSCIRMLVQARVFHIESPAIYIWCWSSIIVHRDPFSLKECRCLVASLKMAELQLSGRRRKPGIQHLFANVSIQQFGAISFIVTLAVLGVRSVSWFLPRQPLPTVFSSTGPWDWSTCRIAPGLVSGETPLILFSSVFVGEKCASVKDSDVILATHLTEDRLPLFMRMLRLWTRARRGDLQHSGCVSVSFGATNTSSLKALRLALDSSLDLTAHVVLHIIIGRQVR